MGTWFLPITITATDASGNTATQDYVLTVATSPVLHITTTSPLPAAQIGVPYSVTLAATGGVLPYRWRIVSSALPLGLRLDPDTGAISGTPRRHASSRSFVVQVRHGNTRTTGGFSITVT